MSRTAATLRGALLLAAAAAATMLAAPTYLAVRLRAHKDT